MSKEISFPAHVQQTISVEIKDEHVEQLKDMQREALIFYVKYHDFRNPCTSFHKEIVSLCEAYSVNPELDSDRVAFFTALLGTIN